MKNELCSAVVGLTCIINPRSLSIFLYSYQENFSYSIHRRTAGGGAERYHKLKHKLSFPYKIAIRIHNMATSSNNSSNKRVRRDTYMQLQLSDLPQGILPKVASYLPNTSCVSFAMSLTSDLFSHEPILQSVRQLSMHQ